MGRRQDVFTPINARGPEVQPVEIAARIGDPNGQLRGLPRLDRRRQVGGKRQFRHDGVAAQFAVAVNFRPQPRAAKRNHHPLPRLKRRHLDRAPPPRYAQVISIGKRRLRPSLRLMFAVRTRAEPAPVMLLHRARQCHRHSLLVRQRRPATRRRIDRQLRQLHFRRKIERVVRPRRRAVRPQPPAGAGDVFGTRRQGQGRECDQEPAPQAPAA